MSDIAEVEAIVSSKGQVTLPAAMRAKLGLTGELATESERDSDWALVEDLLQLLARALVRGTGQG